ncbi:glycosyltransferase [Candidatus Clostridium radicumherbarum]|uniref:Glycosyltransferase n=1 Tax=Candidatus Clostridium radicumherbarum TaxID=3381662 RepID=A0ABW8TPV8_9CLOT
MIVQVGPYPEPIGGISVYIKRMKQYMDLIGIKNEVWDTSGVKKKESGVINVRLRYMPFRLIQRKDVDIIHYNLCGFKSKIYIGILNKLFFKNRKKIITIHGDYSTFFLKDRKYIIRALNSFDCIICVKAGDSKRLVDAGVNKPAYDISAFLFPLKSTENIIPDYISEFIKQKRFIISANASSMQFFNNIDLYGIDMCIDLVAALKNNNLDIGLIFCLPYIDNDTYYKELVNRINEGGIQENFLFVHENIELWKIIERSNLFIRPTCNDGYGVSVAEAVFCKVPAIASDICDRPNGTILFKSRNFKDLFERTVEVIKNYDFFKKKVENVELIDSLERLLSIYRDWS